MPEHFLLAGVRPPALTIAAIALTPGGSGALVFLIATIVVAVCFDFTNGFHDTANAIATSVSTRALPARVAILMATGLNFLGAFVSTQVAKTIGTDVAQRTSLTQVAVMAALLAAIGWNLITWYYGLPSSSSHALIGGLIGAAVVVSSHQLGRVTFEALKGGGILKVVLSLILSPPLGLALAYTLAIALIWIFRRTPPGRVSDISRWLQRLSAAFVAFSHGSNDAQKTMGVITAAVLSYQGASASAQFHVPVWVIILSATAMGLGTSFGGWRIIQTMGMRVVKLRPIDGFAAETAAGSIIIAASSLGLPVSTTHVIAGSIMGVGARQRLGAVRWGVAGDMVVAWILTGPISAIIAALFAIILLAVGLRG
jgi:PiT family inorganic phosphate transporter